MIKFTAIKEKDSFKVNISKTYNDIYDLLSDKTSKCHVFENKISVFVFAASVGYKRNSPKDILIQNSNAIHCQPISEQQLSSLFSIILNDDLIGKNLNNFLDDGYLTKGLKLIEKYAQGGMEILCDDVLEDSWNGSTLSREYTDYGFDLLRFVHTERKNNFTT